MNLPEPPEYLEFLAPYPAATQELARGLRARLVALLPPCVEVLWDATNAVGVAYGFTEVNRDAFIHLPVYTKYVNLGFNRGTELDDPERRLKGTGSLIRHVKLTSVEDLDDPYVLGLLRQAIDGARRPSEAEAPRTVIRVMEGPKRRPRTSA